MPLMHYYSKLIFEFSSTLIDVSGGEPDSISGWLFRIFCSVSVCKLLQMTIAICPRHWRIALYTCSPHLNHLSTAGESTEVVSHGNKEVMFVVN